MDEGSTELVKHITSRQQRLESDRANFTDRWQDVADYVCPYRDDIRGTLVAGEAKGKKIFDGTAEGAAILAADGIHGYHVSPAFPWFQYSMNVPAVNKIPEVKKWLQDTAENMYMALNRSNFYTEMWSFIYDGFTIATSTMYAEEDLNNGRIAFEAVHPGECYIAENRYGEVDCMYRKRKITARKLVQMFGKDKVSEQVKNAYENQPFTEFEVIHAVYPREEYDDRKKDGKNKPFASVWLLMSGNTILREAGFDFFPYNVWRYLKTGKSPYGVGPAMFAMADIKSLNLMSKTIQGAAQMHVEGAYNIPSYLEGKTQLRPRGLNYVKDQDRITRIDTGAGAFPVGIDREQAKQQSIKERFHVDTFLMLTSMQQNAKERTAYEVSELMGEKAAVLGAELGPLNTVLDGIHDQVYRIEYAAGRMPEIPEVLYSLQKQNPHLRFDPTYMGPLAQAQRERFQGDGFNRFIQKAGPLVQVDPTVLDNVDLDEAIRDIADTTGVKSEIIRSKEAVQQIRQQKQQALQAEQAKQDAERLAGGMKDVASADKDTGGAITRGMANAQA
jgi:Bacteriophage head to tail connecting protein